MSAPIRVAVIGYGMAGRIFHTAVVKATPGMELACVVQRTGNDAAEHYPGIKLARSIEEMLADQSIDLAIVATPSHNHFEVAEQCLRAGKNVVIDKPFTLTSDEAARLIHLARERQLIVTAYQNRRWDSDFKTVKQVMASGALGRLVVYEAHYDRFRQEPRLKVWRENGGPGGGLLFDLGPHLIDQAISLFGDPEAITASVRIERQGAVVDDAFDIHLAYPGLTVWLRSTLTAYAPGPRFTLHGTDGTFIKSGLDTQEDALKAGATFDSPGFGYEPLEQRGTLYRVGHEPEVIETLPGDYRGYYASVRDALLGVAPLQVTPEQAWRTTRLIELARQSSAEGRTLKVDFSNSL